MIHAKRGEENATQVHCTEDSEQVIDKIIASRENGTVMAIRSANYDFVNIGRLIGDKFSVGRTRGPSVCWSPLMTCHCCRPNIVMIPHSRPLG
jgi:hypothetical protein